MQVIADQLANVRANTTSVDMETLAEALLDIVYLMRLDAREPGRVVVQSELKDGWRGYSFEPGQSASEVDHPPHYGGADNPWEAIKVIEGWVLGFNLGNAVKYISCAGKKEGANPVEDLEKARWYLDEEIKQWRAGNRGAW